MIGRADGSLDAAIHREIEQQLDEQSYLTWFQRVRFEQLGPDRIAVYVPNRFHLTYLRHRHFQTLGDAIEAVSDLEEPRIEFRVDRAEESPAPSEDDEFPAADLGELPEAIPLNPNYMFEHFVTGPSNRLAHAAAVAVANAPGTTYNPLFIHGPVGLGKTHLMQAVAHVYKSKGFKKIVYISCAAFTNDFIHAVERNETDRFRQKYRQADALLIDDVQFLASKERTQEEFFHTFNSIYNEQKQIFLTSDCSPAEIEGLGERLESRFKLGLVADLGPPTFETRVAILKRKGRTLNMEIPNDVAEFVGRRIRDNVREIEGALMRLHTLVSIERRPLDLPNVEHSLADILDEHQPRIDMPRIQQAILDHYDVKASDLHSKKRSRSIVVPRQVAMFLARRHTSLSLGEIGDYFGGRDHSTVLHSIDKITKAVDTDPRIKSAVDAVERSIR